MKNNLGFTMTELLAAVVILGILMAMAIPSVAGLLTKQKNKMYVEDAIRLGQLAEKKMKSDNSVVIPAVEQCNMMRLDYLDDGTFDSAPYGSYDKTKSFVIIRRISGYYSYHYYVRLVEKIGSKYRGIDLISVYNDGGAIYLHRKSASNMVGDFTGLADGDSYSPSSSICEKGVLERY